MNTWSNVRLSATDRIIVKIAERYEKVTQIYVTSAMDGDHGPSSFHYPPGKAVDFGFGGTAQPARGRDFAKWWYQYSGYLLELIHTTPFSTDNGFYVKYGQRKGPGFYGTATEQAHRDHVHVAMTMSNAVKLLARLTVRKPPKPPAPKPVPKPPAPAKDYARASLEGIAR